MLIVFMALMGLADAWLVAWWIGSGWGIAVAAGTIVGLTLSIGWSFRHYLPAGSVALIITAVALMILLSRSSTSAALFAMLVALAVVGVWCLACDVCFTRRTRATRGRRVRQ